MSGHWIWKAAIAGFCGSAAHTLLMYLKSRTGLLPAFQPYHSFQATLADLTGSEVHPIIPWAMSFLNGSTILGLCFGRIYAWLPGNSGAAKGATFGIFGWLAMGFVFFPLVGLGPFAGKLNLGVWPAVFSLAMLLAYSVVLGVVYAALNSWGEVVPLREGFKEKRRPELGGVLIRSCRGRWRPSYTAIANFQFR